MAEGGVLHAFEVNEEYESHILRHVKQAGVGERVALHIGDAKELLPEVAEEWSTPFVFAFIDADKRSCTRFYDMLVPMMRKGGLIVIDNVLWGNKVVDEERYNDIDTCAFRSFNDYVQSDPRVDNVMLSVRDGIMVCSRV